MDNTSIKYELPGSVEKRLEDENTPYVFFHNAHKSEVYNKPLLVIGLGGSGFDALSRAKEKMVNCFKTNSKGELEGVEFLEIDTDDRDKNECLSKPKPGSLTENEFKIFQNADIGAILRNRKTNSDILPEEIDEWLDPNIPIAQIVHGAAGIRQAGRLLLHLNAVEIIDVINAKLDKIRQSVVLSKNPVNVVIFTGIGGGTGSGTFVDISYIVRECIKGFSGQAFITGIILMPDILAGDPNVDKITKENIKRNGFAALKELDHLMNLSETQDFFTQSYPGGFLVDETNEAIFDRCFLVSSMVEGRLLLPRAKEHAYNIAAEMLIDMVSNSSTVSKGSNDVSRRDLALTNMKNRKPANYVYTAVGGQALYYDFDMVFNLFVKNSLEYNLKVEFTHEQIKRRVDETWKKREIDESIKDLTIARENFPTNNRGLYELVYESFDSKTGRREIKPVTLQYIKDNCNQHYEPTENSAVKDAFLIELEEFDRKARSLYERLQLIYDDIDVRDDQFISEMKSRIQEALSNTVVDSEIEEEESELQKYTRELEKYRLECLAIKKNGNRESRFRQVRRGVNKLFGNKSVIDRPSVALAKINLQEANRIKNEEYNRVIRELIAEIGKLYIPKHEEESKPISQEMLEYYKDAVRKWKHILNEKYNMDYSNYNLRAGSKFVRESVETVWEKADALFGESSIVTTPQVVSCADFRNIKVNEYIETINKLIQNDKGLVDKAARRYKKVMTDNALTMLYQGETGISQEVTTGQIFEELFEELDISLDDVIMDLFNIKKPELEAVYREVWQAILEHSGVLYSKKAMKDGEVFERPSYNEYMVPSNNKMLAAVCKELTGQEPEKSKISHRISCMKYTQCQKIDDYIYIDELERVYNQSNSKCGLHLYENSEPRWAKLPSPVYRNIYADYRLMNRYEDSKIAEKYRYIFYKAFNAKHQTTNDRDHGIIVIDPDSKKMYIDAEMLARKIPSYKPPKDGRVYICNIEYNESMNKDSYIEYCSDWFIKMFKYRDRVAEAMGISVAEISDEDLETVFNFQLDSPN